MCFKMSTVFFVITLRMTAARSLDKDPSSEADICSDGQEISSVL
jgi:hypothetical protein